MAWMETDYSKHALSMEDKMAAGGFGRAGNYGLIAVCSVFEVPLPRFSP